MKKRKLLIIDTSVLLYDKESIHSFPENDVIIPLIVLDELDKFKEKPGLLGESARYVNRYLDNLRSKGRLDVGVEIDDSKQTIRVVPFNCKLNNHLLLDDTRGDNLIIASALSLVDSEPDRTIKVITKDINLRVKCDALGIAAEDYYKDYLSEEETEDTFTGISEVHFTNDQIELLYQDGKIECDECLFPNSYVVCKGSSESISAIAVFRDKNVHLLKGLDTRESETSVRPRNKEQKFALHALRDDSVPLVSLTGLAGSGKTFLTLMAGIDDLYENKYERIVVTRSIQPVGRDLGYLPGDINEKMAPWLSPLLDNFRHHFKDKVYFEMMLEKGEIEIAPLSYIRGRTFNNVYLIVDEAQNASIHELKTIITRLGDQSKVVLMGDTDQIDTPYIDKRSNGLAIVVEKFKTSSLSAHVHLKRGERSAIATYASKVL
jgi:PhoH-like ATPase